MSELDQFESVFRSALRHPYEFREVEIKRILLITDLQEDQADELLQRIKTFLGKRGSDAQWHTLGNQDFHTTCELLDKVEEQQADLICTYRNLHSQAWQYPHSLGEYVDVLLQITKMPVLLLPHPHAGFASEHAMRQTRTIMALTDHLDQNHSLVNAAVSFLQDEGVLYLSHIEDQVYFDRIVDALSKITFIDTQSATEALRKQLLKQPKQYVDSCRQVLSQRFPNITIKENVCFGHRLSEVKQLIDQQKIDLLTMPTKDDDQLAMHGLAYPLVVELRQIPLLML